MKNKARNFFLAFGIIAIVIMLCTMDMDYHDIWRYLQRLGLYFPAILLLWAGVYMINTLSWFLIINDEKRYKNLSYWRVYKLSISGFALNYTTPCGLMGGEPYRIMELKPYIGTSKATSSVILYVMMHIFSHFWFWFLSIFLYIAVHPVNATMAILLTVIGAFCLLAFYFFSHGYRTGMAKKGIKMLTHVPFVKNWAKGFIASKQDTLEQIDQQIAMLHQQHKSTFYSALLLELSSRVIQSFEIYLILRASWLSPRCSATSSSSPLCSWVHEKEDWHWLWTDCTCRVRSASTPALSPVCANWYGLPSASCSSRLETRTLKT